MFRRCEYAVGFDGHGAPIADKWRLESTVMADSVPEGTQEGNQDDLLTKVGP